jgi:hypothetical protein
LLSRWLTPYGAAAARGRTAASVPMKLRILVDCLI